MDRKKSLKIFVLFFLTLTTFLALGLVSKTVILQHRAEGPIEIIFDAVPQGLLHRIWLNFSQGGEEQEPMLAPAAIEIKKLQPQYIRIDHLFDFPNLDQRIEEITNFGATPFLSLSYFPPSVSTNLTDYPSSLEPWKQLIEQTIQRYSGRNAKNYSGIYYEVWNEPDLFGKMTADQYFALYKITIEAANNCSDCNPFKIGGPAITTLKNDWLDRFLFLVNQNQTRIDFVSWHSYQPNPQKTLSETNQIALLPEFLSIKPKPELIISEWGSTPENSPLHDSYFDASHTVNAVSLLKNSPIDKLFAFELKDGPDPQGKTHWGRWGLLTHQSVGLLPKPRYFAFLYLDKLLTYELTPILLPAEFSAIGSTNGKDNYSFVFANNTFQSRQFSLLIKQFPPGIYTLNTFSYNHTNQPETPWVSQVSVNESKINLSYNIEPNSIFLVEIARNSAALVKFPGRSGQDNDFSAKVSSFAPPLIYPINLQENIISGQINFWAKGIWGENEEQSLPLWETKNKSGGGLSAWLEGKSNNQTLHFKVLGKPEEIIMPLNIPNNQWSEFKFYFDNQKRIAGVKVNEEQSLITLNEQTNINLGNFILIGSNTDQTRFFEGLFDNLEILLNNKAIYQDNFD